MIIVLTLAAIALLLNIAGRRQILRMDSSLRGTFRKAVAACPGAELVFMITRWERARSGAGMCALSLALALPFAGEIGVQFKKQTDDASFVSKLISVICATLNEQALQVNAEHQKSTLEQAAKAKFNKVQGIRRYLVDWYVLLQNREAYLCSELPDEISEFNRYAAAYHGLLAASKLEGAELDRMQSKQGDKKTIDTKTTLVTSR